MSEAGTTQQQTLSPHGQGKASALWLARTVRHRSPWVKARSTTARRACATNVRGWTAAPTETASMACARAFPERSRSWLNTLARNHIMVSLNYGGAIFAMDCRAARLALADLLEIGARAHSRTATLSVTVHHATTRALSMVPARFCGQSDALAATQLATPALREWTWRHARSLRTSAIPLVEAPGFRSHEAMPAALC